MLGTEAGAPRGGKSTPGGALMAVEPAEPRDKTEAKRRSPGKPSKTTEIVAEFDRRCAANQCLASLTREAGWLRKWYSLHYANMPQPAHSTVRNNIRSGYREWKRVRSEKMIDQLLKAPGNIRQIISDENNIGHNIGRFIGHFTIRR